MYADDTNLSVTGESASDIEVRLNTELENVHEWLTANKLTLNTEKTEYMIIGSYKRISGLQKEDEIKIRIGDNEIKRVKTTKSLGIVIDENLAWKENIDNLSVKVSRAIGVIRRAKKYVKQDALKLMYNSLVLPYFDYCSLVWNNCSQTLKTKVQRLQNRAARVITGDTYDIRSKDVLSKLGWNNLEERRNSQTISYVNNALQKNCPEGITEMFQFSCNDNHNLRSNNLMLRLAKPKTNAMKKSFSYAAANIWNSQSISERKKVINLIQ